MQPVVPCFGRRYVVFTGGGDGFAALLYGSWLFFTITMAKLYAEIAKMEAQDDGTVKV